MSEPEEVLAGQLRMLKIPTPSRQARFHSRRWKADFLWPGLIVEVDGGVFSRGRHVRPLGFTEDIVKSNEAQLLGYVYLRCTTEQVESMDCVGWIERALGVGEKAA